MHRLVLPVLVSLCALACERVEDRPTGEPSSPAASEEPAVEAPKSEAPAAPSGSDELPEGGCDLAELEALSTELKGLSIVAQSEQVWPGLRSACSTMPKALAGYYAYLHDPEDLRVALVGPGDKELIALKLAACPKLDELDTRLPPKQRALALFEGCDFGRFGVLDAGELFAGSYPLMTFSTHNWLLAQGLEAEAARDVTRAIYALEFMDLRLVSRRPGLRLPVAHGDVLRGPMVPVYLSDAQLEYEERQLVAIQDGRLDPRALEDHLIVDLLGPLRTQVVANEGEAPGLLVAADAGTRYATLVDLLYTASRAGIHAHHFALAPERFEDGVLPTVAAGLGESGPVMTIELTSTGLSLASSESGGEPVEHPLGATEAVEAYAKALRERAPDARRVYLWAESEVKLERVLAVLAAARGSACQPSGEGCWLPKLSLMAEPVHASEPSHSSVMAIAIGDEPESMQALIDEEGEGALANLFAEGMEESVIADGPIDSFVSGGEASVTISDLQVSGGIDEETVESVLNRRKPSFLKCYDSALERDPQLEGAAELEFEINETGRVSQLDLRGSTMSDAAGDACLRAKLKAIRFPYESDQGKTTVRVSINLASA